MEKQKPLIIANWKMKLGVPESRDLANKLKGKSSPNYNLVVCPSFVSLTEVAKVLKTSKVKLGAQDCFWEKQGSYTGEVSATYLKEVGCDYVIIGHSERRQYIGETDTMVNKKIDMALQSGLIPILCVGETFDQKVSGSRDTVLINQVTRALESINIAIDEKIIIAYEPVWAIGSGQSPDPVDIWNAHQVIRQSLFDIFPATIVKNSISIIYGGSVSANNIASFLNLDNTQGVLVGTASFEYGTFEQLLRAVNK